MHIETLKVFCDLVDLESFSLAAERNFITQSAVSQQIRTLEEKFKRRLLERIRGRRIAKIPAGAPLIVLLSLPREGPIIDVFVGKWGEPGVNHVGPV